MASSCTRFSWSHNHAPQSVGLLWTSDQLVAETSTWQHTTHVTDKHPCLRWDFFKCTNSLFEPTIAAGERPYNYALDRAATGTGRYIYLAQNNINNWHLFVLLRSCLLLLTLNSFSLPCTFVIYLGCTRSPGLSVLRAAFLRSKEARFEDDGLSSFRDVNKARNISHTFIY
jgi:hypothetical protein